MASRSATRSGRKVRHCLGRPGSIFPNPFAAILSGHSAQLSYDPLSFFKLSTNFCGAPSDNALAEAKIANATDARHDYAEIPAARKA